MTVNQNNTIYPTVTLVYSDSPHYKISWDTPVVTDIKLININTSTCDVTYISTTNELQSDACSQPITGDLYVEAFDRHNEHQSTSLVYLPSIAATKPHLTEWRSQLSITIGSTPGQLVVQFSKPPSGWYSIHSYSVELINSETEQLVLNITEAGVAMETDDTITHIVRNVPACHHLQDGTNGTC